ncbi:hypothetical protein R1sor_023966 [Riccia sorocarpa]|uniref:DUF4812 domain-containing protein n=1 Tax=Riccia sorocarpa TaxID=122646 RepID=A0ABD3GSE5_9MARC
MVTYLWTPKRRHCTRITKDKDQYKTGMYHRNFRTADGKIAKRTIKHLMTDYSHILPKLHCPWDDKSKSENSPGLVFHGLKQSDVTLRLRPPPPSHAANPDLKDAPGEWHGRQAQDVTEIYTYMCRGQHPPSRDYWYGREATDISDHLRIIPPIAPEGEAREFHGRPKSDVTDYNIFPEMVPETDSRTEAAHPLGKAPPGPMADYVALVRDKDGKLLHPQPPSPPKSPSKRHDPKNQEPLKPGGGGILSQIVEGTSRSEGKRPLGQVPPGVMVDYLPLKRDEHGKLIPQPRRIFPAKQDWRSKDMSPRDPVAERIDRYSYEKLHPLGKVPGGVMVDYKEVHRPPHKHTTDGLYSPPTTWPEETNKLGSGNKSPCKNGKWSPGPVSQSEAASKTAATLQDARQKLQFDSGVQHSRRDAKVCPVHDGTMHEPNAANVKWPDDGDNKQTPCKSRSLVKLPTPVSERQKVPLSRSANANLQCYGSKKDCDPIKHDPRMAKPSSVCASSPRSVESVQADPRCECPKEKRAVEYSDWTAVKKSPSYAPSRGSDVGSPKGSGTSGGGKKNVIRAKKNKIISPVMTPEHFQAPYFGHTKTYVTDPGLSPNLTPPVCGLIPKPNINPHIPDGKASWFGRTKSYVTDPAVSPNLTPPNRG